MPAAKIRIGPGELRFARLEAESCGLAGNRTYMEHLKSPHADCRACRSSGTERPVTARQM